MIEINVDELNQFSDNYYQEINKLETYLNENFEQLLNLKEAINTPNITKKINDFNELYYQAKGSIKESNLYLDKQVKNIIHAYHDLYKDIKKGVSNE
ncbi:MAG: hypothetical protein J6X02_01280 [Bacilli bacterium]|nr:hypothetical protein [Bacilli bacterium]